tara:strand:- start:212 stop:412 length:201 start_codon:yes stop_codon:yes gene_type:complete
MIAIEVTESYVTFDVIDMGEGLPSLVDATKAIRNEMGWALAECVSAARMLLSLKSINLTHTIEIGA